MKMNGDATAYIAAMEATAKACDRHVEMQPIEITKASEGLLPKHVDVIPLPEHQVDKARQCLLFMVRSDQILSHDEADGAATALPKIGSEWGEGTGRIVQGFTAHCPDGSDGRFWILTLFYKIPTEKA